jgi:hypothetical protein
MTHHGYAEKLPGRSGPTAAALNLSDAPPEQFKPLGRIEPQAHDRTLQCKAWGHWLGLALDVYKQWRWDHDREAVLAEDEREEAQELQELLASRRARSKPVPLATLRKERLFVEWEESVPPATLRKCRAIIRKSIDELIALGPRPKRAAAMAVLRSCTEQLNALDKAQGGFIDTIEREDLCAAIDRLGNAVGIRTKESVADAWREW